MSEFIALIPARLASSRLPEKPLADIAGKPMVVRVAERALLSGARAVYIATDDERILQAAQTHGVPALLTSPVHSSGTERLAEAADLLGLSDETIVVNVQGDEPLIDPDLIAAVAQMLQCSENLPMATACHPIHSVEELFNPNVVKVVLDKDGRALYFSRAPIPFARDAFMQAERPSQLETAMPVFRHIGIYAYRAGFLRQYRALTACALEQVEALEQLRVLWHGYPIGVSITATVPEAGVDTPQDLERVRKRYVEITS